MSTVADILRLKGFEVVTVPPEATVLEAAREMNLRRIGALVVVEDPDTGGRLGAAAAGATGAEGRGRPMRHVVGIITERDVLTRVVAAERDARRTLVREVMTTPVVYCSRRTPLTELKHLMRHRRIRHVPVIDEGELLGMVSIGDLNAMETESLMQTITVLEEYITRG